MKGSRAQSESARTDAAYGGFEQGPIRPPSEARSLLIRVTRNCPWNRCTFCPVYKGETFSIRPVAHVMRDIDAVHHQVQILQSLGIDNSDVDRQMIMDAARRQPAEDLPAFQAALHWITAGAMKSVFLQDANSMAVKPDHLLQILKHLGTRFPSIERVTTYARSASIARLTADQLVAFRQAGLIRIHVGLESGSDRVLRRVQKGVTKQIHICAGRQVKEAGIELSEYYMPGLGGRDHWREHALESADALSQIDPDYIRLRSLVIPGKVPLAADQDAGSFVMCTEVEVQEEILLFLESLTNVTAKIRSDHIMNLLPEVDGKLPRDRQRLQQVIRDFLKLAPQEQTLYRIGRRLGLFNGLKDLADGDRRRLAEQNLRLLGIDSGNCDRILEEMVRRFV